MDRELAPVGVEGLDLPAVVGLGVGPDDLSPGGDEGHGVEDPIPSALGEPEGQVDAMPRRDLADPGDVRSVDRLADLEIALEEGLRPRAPPDGEATLELEGEELVGLHIVRRALEEPVRTIAVNAGAEGSVVVDKLRAEKAGVGYNAATNEITDLIKDGVIDPAKVTKNALLNASSIAGLLLTTEALVAEIPEEKKESAMPPGGMDGMGMM